MLGVPLEDAGGPYIVMKPLLAGTDHPEDLGIGTVLFELGLTLLLADPGLSRLAIRIEDPREVVLLEVRETEDDSQKFADVIGTTLIRSAMEDFCARIGYDATEFHKSGIATTSGIYREGGIDG